MDAIDILGVEILKDVGQVSFNTTYMVECSDGDIVGPMEYINDTSRNCEDRCQLYQFGGITCSKSDWACFGAFVPVTVKSS